MEGEGEGSGLDLSRKHLLERTECRWPAETWSRTRKAVLKGSCSPMATICSRRRGWVVEDNGYDQAVAFAWR